MTDRGQPELNPKKKRRQNEDNLRQLSLTTMVKASSNNVMPHLRHGQSVCQATNVQQIDGQQNVFRRANAKRNRNALERNGIVFDTALGSSLSNNK